MNSINSDLDRSIIDLCKKKNDLLMKVQEIDESIKFLEKQKKK